MGGQSGAMCVGVVGGVGGIGGVGGSNGGQVLRRSKGPSCDGGSSGGEVIVES